MRRRVRTMRAQGCAVRVDGSAARGRQCAARRRSGTGRLVGSNRRASWARCPGSCDAISRTPRFGFEATRCPRGAFGERRGLPLQLRARVGGLHVSYAGGGDLRSPSPSVFFASSKVGEICQRLSLSLLSLIASLSLRQCHPILSYPQATYRITPLERRGRRPWTYSYRSRSPGMIGAVAGVRAHRKRHGSTITKGPTNKPVIIDGVQVLTDADRDHHQGKRSPRN
jgi:hypothetical protein